MKRNILIIVFLMVVTASVVSADRFSAGDLFYGSDSNVTYFLTEDITCDHFSTDRFCFNVTGGDFAGNYCDVSPVAKIIYLGSPLIDNVSLTVIDLLKGNQRYNISFNAVDVDDDIMTCSVNTQSGTINLSYNSTTNLCFGEINLTQSDTNSFIPNATDGTTIENGTALEGVEIIFNTYLSDQTKTSNLETQYYLQQYNITNHEDLNFTNISWSLNSTDPVKQIDLYNLTTLQENRTLFQGDFITEDLTYTFSGTQFLAESTYSTIRYLLYNNTKSYPLPGIELVIPLKAYNDTFLSEKQDGLLWPDLTSYANRTSGRFNITELNTSNHTWYRYGYNAVFIDWTGDKSSDYRLSGSNKEWTLERVYEVNFNLTGKVVIDYILAANLNEWPSKTGTWGSTLTRQDTNSTYNHTTTDLVTTVKFQFDPPSDNYTYQLLYYTPITVSPAGGGGGGGISPINQVVETTNQSTVQIQSFGKVIYANPLQNFLVNNLPSTYYSEQLITANGTIAGVIEFSENLQPYCVADVCDVGSTECDDEVFMDDGEIKLLRLLCNITDDVGDIIVEDQMYEGLLKIRTPQTVSNLGLRLEKSPIYGIVRELSKTTGLPEQIIGFVIGLIIVVLGGLIIYYIATQGQGFGG